jgi:hypothetical protein
MKKTLAILVVLAVLGAGGYFLLTKYSISIKQKPLETTDQDENGEEPATEPTPQITPTQDSNGWTTYANPGNVYSIKIPTLVYAPNGSCEYVTQNGRSSYRPKGAFVPTKIFSGADVTRIATQYTSLLGDRTATGDGYTVFGTCTKADITEQNLDDKNMLLQYWTLKTETINSDQDLLAYIKRTYGTGCSVGDKTLSNQSGTYDVTIKGDGLGLDLTKCPINFMYVIKYSPEKKKLVNWDRGQSCYFAASSQMNCYDDEMENSFKFLP